MNEKRKEQLKKAFVLTGTAIVTGTIAGALYFIGNRVGYTAGIKDLTDTGLDLAGITTVESGTLSRMYVLFDHLRTTK